MPSVFYFIASHQFELNLDLIESTEFINSFLGHVVSFYLMEKSFSSFLDVQVQITNQEVLPGGVVLDAINLVSEANYTK